MGSKVDTEAVLRAWANAFLRDYVQWFCIHDRKWWRRHEIYGSWSTVGARVLAEQRVSESVLRLDPVECAWAYERARQPYAVKRVLELAAPTLRVSAIPGPEVDLVPEARAALQEGRFTPRPPASSPPAPPDAATPAPQPGSTTDRTPTSPTPADPGGTGG